MRFQNQRDLEGVIHILPSKPGVIKWLVSEQLKTIRYRSFPTTSSYYTVLSSSCPAHIAYTELIYTISKGVLYVRGDTKQKDYDVSTLHITTQPRLVELDRLIEAFTGAGFVVEIL